MRLSHVRVGVTVTAGLLAIRVLTFAQTTSPVLAVWWPAAPALPTPADLAGIGAAGFQAIVWPASAPGGFDQLRALTTQGGLTALTRAPTPRRTGADLKQDLTGQRIDLSGTAAEVVAPFIWRAMAHGAREIAVDPGTAAPPARGSSTVQRPVPASLNVRAITRQLQVNGGLFAQLSPAPVQPVIETARPDIDIQLLQSRRSFVVIATNTSAARQHVVAHLPPAVPYAIWVNLLDGGTLAMRFEPRGAFWDFFLDAYGTKIYVIDKDLK